MPVRQANSPNPWIQFRSSASTVAKIQRNRGGSPFRKLHLFPAASPCGLPTGFCRLRSRQSRITLRVAYSILRSAAAAELSSEMHASHWHLRQSLSMPMKRPQEFGPASARGHQAARWGPRTNYAPPSTGFPDPASEISAFDGTTVHVGFHEDTMLSGSSLLASEIFRKGTPHRPVLPGVGQILTQQTQEG